MRPDEPPVRRGRPALGALVDKLQRHDGHCIVEERIRDGGMVRPAEPEGPRRRLDRTSAVDSRAFGGVLPDAAQPSRLEGSERL